MGKRGNEERLKHLESSLALADELYGSHRAKVDAIVQGIQTIVERGDGFRSLTVRDQPARRSVALTLSFLGETIFITHDFNYSPDDCASVLTSYVIDKADNRRSRHLASIDLDSAGHIASQAHDIKTMESNHLAILVMLLSEHPDSHARR